jgi:YD repeat-containing protein
MTNIVSNLNLQKWTWTLTKQLKLALLLSSAVHSQYAVAQDATTYGLSAEVPVFERIDQNGVDLVTGSFRVTSPTYETGTDEAKTIVGLQWTGKAWTHIEQPTLWRNNDKYIVNYLGTSQEFKNYSNNFAENKPITGAKLNCVIWQPGGLTSECVYTHRNGDILHFRGRYSSITPYAASYGTAALAWGNIGISNVTLFSADNRTRTWGSASPGAPPTDNNYYSTNKGLGPFTINTPNHNTDTSKHYLRPKNTTQTFTDPYSTQWKYTINNSNLMTKVDRPGNAADITITYSNGRVSSVANPNGTWTYAYSSTTNNVRTTTVTNPQSEVTKVKYNTVKSYVLEHTDPLNRVTKYEYDAGDRLSKVTFPELNYVTFVYDSRGNVVSKTEYPKPGSGLAPITETAEYATTCTNAVLCNLPISVTDSLSRKTDFEYPSTTTQTAPYYGSGFGSFTYQLGTTKPKTVTSPAPTAGAPRPQVRNEYLSGVLTRSAYCRTLASCIGTSDEVVTTYDYGGTEATTRLLYGMSVTSEGQTLTTCYDYDPAGRRVSETPPRANVTVCPKVVAPASGGSSPVTAQPSAAPVFPTP